MAASRALVRALFLVERMAESPGSAMALFLDSQMVSFLAAMKAMYQVEQMEKIPVGLLVS